MPPNYPCDMHCHTLRSDGNDTPQELIDNAAEQGLHAVGLCDHDIDPPRTIELADGSEIDSIAYARRKGIVLLLGYEFSCDKFVDDVHICGYGLDWDDPRLAEEVAAAARSKADAYRELTELLTANGMPVDWEADILHYTDATGAPAERAPEEVQRKHIFEAIAARGYTETWSDAKIMVRDNPALNNRRRKIDPVAAIELCHACGGIAILAHPYLIDEEVEPEGLGTMTRRAYIDRLFDHGLDGIEVRYTYDKTSYKGTMTPAEIEEETCRLFGDRAGRLSGGSDYHAGHKKGSKKVRHLGERGLNIDEFDAAFGDIAARSNPR